MKYFVHDNKNQNDSKKETYFGAKLIKRMQYFDQLLAGFDLAFVTRDLTQILAEGSGSSHGPPMRGQNLKKWVETSHSFCKFRS